ncbi:MAG: hypothetical protein QW815_02125, partial [Nitrososphaerota archaeon]
ITACRTQPSIWGSKSMVAYIQPSGLLSNGSSDVVVAAWSWTQPEKRVQDVAHRWSRELGAATQLILKMMREGVLP